jgi:hypothetical protein
VHERLARGSHPDRVDAFAQPVAIERPVGGKRALDLGDRPLRVVRRHALLCEPTGALREEGRRGQRLKPRVVLAPNEVQRAAVQPRDQERAILGEGAVHVRRAEPLASRPHREPRPARILALDGEQPFRDRHRVARGLPGEQLSGEASTEHGGKLA